MKKLFSYALMAMVVCVSTATFLSCGDDNEIVPEAEKAKQITFVYVPYTTPQVADLLETFSVSRSVNGGTASEVYTKKNMWNFYVKYGLFGTADVSKNYIKDSRYVCGCYISQDLTTADKVSYKVTMKLKDNYLELLKALPGDSIIQVGSEQAYGQVLNSIPTFSSGTSGIKSVNVSRLLELINEDENYMQSRIQKYAEKLSKTLYCSGSEVTME